MNKIVSKEHFSANVVKLEVEAPLIARSRKAGHFVIVKQGEKIQAGYVIKAGPGYPLPAQNEEREVWEKKADEEVRYLPLQAREGDLAIYLQNSAYEITFNEERYLIVPHSAILMLVRDEGPFE